MTGADLLAARLTLGQRWIGRPLSAADMGRLLGTRNGREPGAKIRDYERGFVLIPGPVVAAVEAWLDGATPRRMAEILELETHDV